MSENIGEASKAVLEFIFDGSEHACERKLNAFRFRCERGEMYIVVERNGDGEGRRVRFCILDQKDAETEEDYFLLRSDGTRHQIEFSEEDGETLFRPDQLSQTSESTMLVFLEQGIYHRVVMSRTYEMTLQDRVVEIMDRIVDSSHFKFPSIAREDEHIAQKLEFVFDGVRGGSTTALSV